MDLSNQQNIVCFNEKKWEAIVDEDQGKKSDRIGVKL